MEPTSSTSLERTGASCVTRTADTLTSRNVRPAVDELLSLTDGLVAASSRRNLVAARDRIATGGFNLVVLGEFKRGKSTLINALLRRDLLPTGVVPLTSIVTAIGAGTRDRLVIRYDDGRTQDRPIAELADYVTEARNPGNGLGVELARVELDHELLRAGLELVDTPGIGSIHAHNTEAARGFLPRVDAALCVLDAGQPLSEAERQLFVEVAERVPRLLIVVNKIDHLDRADREDAIEFVGSAAREALDGADTELFAVSATRGDGLALLAARLRRLAADERPDLLLHSVAGLVSDVAAEAGHAARLQSRAIELPLEELSARARVFEQRIGELQDASAEAEDLLERGVQRALTQHVNEPLVGYARQQEPRLRAALHGHLEQLPRSSPRALAAELDGWIQATVRTDFEQLVPRFEEQVVADLSELEQRHAIRVRRILEQVQEVAEDVFGAPAGDMLPDTGVRGPSRFSFKLTDVENALDMIVGFGRTVAPGRFGRRFVIRDAEQRLIAMTDRHAGRLRSELAERMVAAAREYRRELAATVDEAVRTIGAAVERAVEDRGQGEQHARARLAELDQIERRCRQLAAGS